MNMKTSNNEVPQHNGSEDRPVGAKGNGREKHGFKRLWIWTIILFVLVFAGGSFSVWTVHRQAVNDIAVVQANLDAAESTLGQAQEQNAADTEALQTDLANIKTSMEEAQKQNTADVEALQTDLANIKTTMEETQKQNTADTEALRTDLANIKTAMEETQKQNTADTEALQTDLANIKTAMEETQKQNAADVEALQTDLANIKTAMEETQKQNAADVEALETKLADIETVFSEAKEQRKTEMAAVQTELSNAEMELAALVERVSAAEEEMSGLQTKLDEYTSDIVVTRTITTDTASEGQTVTILYQIENRGKVSITNLALQEDSDIRADKMIIAAELKAGESAEVSLAVVMGQRSLISKATITYSIANGLDVQTYDVEASMITFKPEEGKSRTELNWNIGEEPKTLDPCFISLLNGSDIINQVFEGLVREKSGIVYPGIAESWETSEDGLTVTFHLRKSKWSDGTSLTAKDFLYTWLRSMNPAIAAEYNWLWESTHIVGAWSYANGSGAVQDVGISALDDYTLEVQLTEPTAYFVSLMAFYYFMPVKQAAVEAAGGEEGKWASNPALIVSNGAFVLAEYTTGEGLRLEANPEYWNAEEVQLTAIHGKFIDENDVAYAAYKAGELDIIQNVPVGEISRLIEEDPNFHVFPLLGTYYYIFNMDLDIWSDARVRKALAFGFNQQAVCDRLASGQVPALGLISPGFLDADGNDFSEVAGRYDLSGYDARMKAAKTLLAQAGYPNGEGFPTVTLKIYSSVAHRTIAEIIQEQWKTNLGINCVVETLPWEELHAARAGGDFELAYSGWLVDYMDPIGMLENFKNLDASYNFANYYNLDFETALDEATAAADPAAHFTNLYAAYKIFIEDTPVIPIFHYSDTLLVSSAVKGWGRSVLDVIDFTGAGIAE